MNKLKALGFAFYLVGYIVCILEIIVGIIEGEWHFPSTGFVIGFIGSVFLNIENFKNNS